MEKIDDSWAEYSFFDGEFPDADAFYRSRKIPVMVIIKGDVIDLVRVGKVGSHFGNLLTSYELTSMLEWKISHEFEKVYINYPYELMACRESQSAINVLVDPYYDDPSIKSEGVATSLDFTTKGFIYKHPVVIYYYSGKLVGFDIHRRRVGAVR